MSTKTETRTVRNVKANKSVSKSVSKSAETQPATEAVKSPPKTRAPRRTKIVQDATGIYRMSAEHYNEFWQSHAFGTSAPVIADYDVLTIVKFSDVETLDAPDQPTALAKIKEMLKS